MERALDLMKTGIRQAAPVRYGATLGLVGMSISARLGLEPVLLGSPFLLSYPVVFVVALFFGRNAGLVAIALYVISTAFLQLPPLYNLRVDNPGQVVALVTFAVLSLAIVWLTDIMHSALARAATAEREKDLLLHEAHHRIRNDLQSVGAILRLAKSRSDKQAAWIDLALTRIDVLNRVYVRLRTSQNIPVVDTREFIETLVEDLRTATAGVRPIAVHASIDRALISGGCAVALGIVINELVTNALKYAFPDDRPGSIDVSFRREAGEFVLRICDDGVGITSSKPQGTGVGAKLLRQVAMQLRGTLDITGGHGVQTVLRFPAASAGVYPQRSEATMSSANPDGRTAPESGSIDVLSTKQS